MDSHLLNDVLSQFDTAMLVTHDDSVGLRARPLTIADRDADGSLWFFTSSNSGKALEIEHDRRVAVVLQSDRQFVSVTGSARLDASPERLEALFRESFRPWFPGGAHDPNAVALEVKPSHAEVWNLEGTKGLAYVLHALRALVSRERADDAPGETSYHVRVDANE